MTFAVAGHMDRAEETAPLVRAGLRELLARYDGSDLAGVSCIAAGSDALFAEVVLRVGGRLVVVVPGRDDRERKVEPGDAAELLRRAERLVAVRDGRPIGRRRAGCSSARPVAGAPGVRARRGERARRLGRRPGVRPRRLGRRR
ncbi:hypothetical protein, partial [Streptomyces triticirhizae]|uniref:hypothetical protein n=1 Tax=Streptomyces triticirhizae TaxID=2483353 RepID=UPI0013155996